MESPAIPLTDVWVVSEDHPGEWRVADRARDAVLGPFPDEAAATRCALEGVRTSRAWVIYVIDHGGVEKGNFNGGSDGRHFHDG